MLIKAHTINVITIGNNNPIPNISDYITNHNVCCCKDCQAHDEGNAREPDQGNPDQGHCGKLN